MGIVLPFRTPADMRIRIPIDTDAAINASRRMCLRPGPAESPGDFVARIVRAYKEEGGK